MNYRNIFVQGFILHSKILNFTQMYFQLDNDTNPYRIDYKIANDRLMTILTFFVMYLIIFIFMN